MDLIKTSRTVLEKIDGVKKASREWVTNYYHDQDALDYWIGMGRFFHEQVGDTVFFFRPDSDFLHVHYIAPSYDALGRGLAVLSGRPEILVADVIARVAARETPLKVFQDSGFHLYNTLMRMSKAAGPAERGTDFDEEVRLAERSDAPGIHEILAAYFDRYAEQVLSVDEIERETRRGNILVCEKDGRLIGLAHFERTGLTSHWRRWYVDPAYRDLRVGSRLRNSYFFLTREAARHIFWVLTTNEHHIRIQRKWGFQEDGLIDMIFINKGHVRYGR